MAPSAGHPDAVTRDLSFSNSVERICSLPSPRAWPAPSGGGVSAQGATAVVLVSHQGRVFPTQFKKLPLCFSESAGSTMRIPRTLSSTGRSACNSQGNAELNKPDSVLQGHLPAPGTLTVSAQEFIHTCSTAQIQSPECAHNWRAQ